MTDIDPIRSDYMRIDCGCEFWNEREVFVIKPCQPKCEIYRFTIEETRRQGNPVEYRAQVTGAE